MAGGGHQYYGGAGAPLVVPGRPDRVGNAWRSQRARLREWFSGLPEGEWSGATRCDEWSVTDLAQHLIGVTKYLNFTLTEAANGRATRLLEGFDPKAGPAALVAGAPPLPPQELIDALAEVDARVDAVIAGTSGAGWLAPAEAPPGQVPAYLSLTHMLFDSWVHERDLMLPCGQIQATDPEEAALVSAYVVGLAGIARAEEEDPPARQTLLIHVTDIDLTLQIEVSPDGVRVSETTSSGAPNAAGRAADLVDFTTGREPAGELRLDEAAGAYLNRLVARMN